MHIHHCSSIPKPFKQFPSEIFKYGRLVHLRTSSSHSQVPSWVMHKAETRSRQVCVLPLPGSANRLNLLASSNGAQCSMRYQRYVAGHSRHEPWYWPCWTQGKADWSHSSWHRIITWCLFYGGETLGHCDISLISQQQPLTISSCFKFPFSYLYWGGGQSVTIQQSWVFVVLHSLLTTDMLGLFCRIKVKGSHSAYLVPHLRTGVYVVLTLYLILGQECM